MNDGPIYMDELSLFGVNYVATIGKRITHDDIERLKDLVGRDKYPNFDIIIVAHYD